MGLNHIDVLVDAGTRYTIDIQNRSITGLSGKMNLIQYDHNSERVGFSIDRYVDGHDMSKTDRISVNYTNGTNIGTYIVEDKTLSSDSSAVEFSWLISRGATSKVGTLAFVVNFRCFNNDNEVEYNWSTKPCVMFKVLEGIDVQQGPEYKDFVDLIERFEQEIADMSTPEISDEQLTAALEIYFEDNPLPSKTSDLVNDSGFVTNTVMNTTKQDIILDLPTIRSGAALGATALQNVPDTYAKKTDIPNINGYATETWVEGKGYLTTHQSLASKQDVILDLTDIRSGAAKGATALQSVPSDYAKKSEIPAIPTNISSFTNDSGYLTEHQSLSNYYSKTEINSSLSQKADKTEIPSLNGYATQTWVENKGYLTSHQTLKTINNESIVGSGNVTISATMTESDKADIVQRVLNALPSAEEVDF